MFLGGSNLPRISQPADFTYEKETNTNIITVSEWHKTLKLNLKFRLLFRFV